MYALYMKQFVRCAHSLRTMQPGDGQAGYVRHLDAAPGSGNESRRLTFVYYFNSEVCGGELRLHCPGRVEWFPSEGGRRVWDGAAVDPVPAWMGVRPGFSNGEGGQTPVHWDISPIFGRLIVFRR